MDEHYRVSAPVNFIVNLDAAVLNCGHEELLGDGADRMIEINSVKLMV